MKNCGCGWFLYNFNISKRYLWIDSLSQSWTNPMHLLGAYGSLTLSQSCLLPVCLWDCKYVSAPKFMYGCFSNLFLWCFSMIKISIWCNIFVSDLFLGLVIQYQDLCMIITFVDMVLLEFPFTGFIEKCC